MNSHYMFNLHDLAEEYQESPDAEFTKMNDDQALKIFLQLDHQHGDIDISCPYCTCKLKRNYLLSSHLAQCGNRYHKLVKGERLIISELEPVVKKQKFSGVESESDVTTDTKPVKSYFDISIQQCVKEVDPSRCLYFLDKHPSSRPKNHQQGFNLVNSCGENVRICNVGHFFKPGERKLLKMLITAFTKDTFPFDDKHQCPTCLSEQKVLLQVIVGRNIVLSTDFQAIRTLYFCNELCFTKFVASFGNISKWNKQVTKWKDEIDDGFD